MNAAIVESASLTSQPTRSTETPLIRPSHTLRYCLAAITFLGAFLLFQVQPLVGKAILPWFGGSPAVWTTALVLFQVLLTAAYAFVHLTTRMLAPRTRSYVFLAAAALSTAMLPILPGPQWKPSAGDAPITAVLLLLAACVGAPYFLLATTGPLIQEWYARLTSGLSPYRLYALSNLGSLLGLLTYPFLVEPLFDLPTQNRLWCGGFVVYCLIASISAWRMRGVADLADVRHDDSSDKHSIFSAETAAWVGLAGGGSLMLSATTNHLCQDVPTVPFLWIAPLAVYLVTFIIAFSSYDWYRRGRAAAAAMILIFAACVPSIPYSSLTSLPQWLANPLLTLREWPYAVHLAVTLAMLFAICLLAHGELASWKPAPRRLTAYYLSISVGGALGGLFVGVIAPLLYSRFWEWIVGTTAAYVLAAIAVFASQRTQIRAVRPVFALLAVVGGSALAWLHLNQFNPYEAVVARNFYGVVYVDAAWDEDTNRPQWTAMRSGSTRHGAQNLEPGRSRVPTTYYGRESAVGLALLRGRSEDRPRHVGVIGLGVGTLAAYGLPGDRFRFYEINPAVIEFAKTYFFYLRESAAQCDIVPGDARLSLEQESPQAFDMLILDAFTGDAIPTHLLTIEAFEGYLRHLRDDGILAVHVSNRHLNLTPVVIAAAERFGLADLTGLNRANLDEFVEPARWILLTRRPESRWWQAVRDSDLAPSDRSVGIAPWTDAHGTLFDLLK